MCYRILLVLGLFLSLPASFGQSVPAQKDLARFKRDSAILERILGEVLRQNFDNPFAVAAEPKAAYLAGYGVTVSFYLKINRGTIRGFYGEIRNPLVQTPRTRKQQLETVKDSMIQALGDYGSTIKLLRPSEQISICAHVEDRNELDASRKLTVLVISVAKADLDNYATKSISFEEFKKRVQVLEY